KAAELCQDLLGVPLCAAEVCTLERRLTAAMDPVVAELRIYVRSQNAKMEETTWWLGNQRAYLWVVVTAEATLFYVDPSRAGAVAQSLVDVESVAGGRFVANILSIVATCRQQRNKALDTLTACSQAVLTGGRPPSL